MNYLLRLAPACGVLVLLCGTSPANADPVTLVNTVRKQPCGATLPPLAHVAALDTAARRIADGAALRAAITASGYRARNASVLSFEGVRSDDDLTRVLAQSCARFTQAGIRDAGFHLRGNTVWIVLAEPFALPVLDQAKTGARILDLVNRARAQPRRCGNQDFGATRPLRWSPRLEQAALAHARDMAARGVLSHEGSDGSRPAQRVTRAGYAWIATGENVAAGQRDADSVMQSWLSSPGHCANVMSPDYTEMAVAFATNAKSDAGIFWAQEFGAPDGKPAARRR